MADRERAGTARRGGRPAVTSHTELAHAALGLFATRGFEATTVGDIAAAAGIGRRTFFRYYASKNDVVWGDFDAELGRMRALLAARPGDEPLMTSLRHAVLDFNTFSPDEAPWHRRRMAIVLTVPALQAHLTLRYAAWRRVVAEFVAARHGGPPDAPLPRAVSHALLAICVASYEQWLADDETDLLPVLTANLHRLEHGFRTD